MRTIAVVAILLLGISSAWPELEHAVPGSLNLVSSPVAALPPVQTMEPTQAAPAPAPNPAQVQSTPVEPLDQVCNTLLTSAQDNDLPVPFFANLIWQESRLRNNAVSPKGAVGIAQLMPKIAAKSGVENPFDPSQALPASAKLLRELFDRFGNLGYVAAAYNAGTQRVVDWLERGRSLPRETRGYVMNITGRSIAAWRKTPTDDANLRFARGLPCRGLPAFAELEQAQAKQAGLERKQAEQARAQVTSSQQVSPSQQATASPPATASQQKQAKRSQQVAKAPAAKLRARHARLAKDDRSHKRIAKREQPRINREARGHVRYVLRERHRRA